MVFARQYAPIITFPIAVVIGVIGYNIETSVSSRETPEKNTSVQDERDDRKLKEILGGSSEDSKYTKGIPKTVLDRNNFQRYHVDPLFKGKSTAEVKD